MEVVVEEIGPSLAWATAAVTKTGVRTERVPTNLADPTTAATS